MRIKASGGRRPYNRALTPLILDLLAIRGKSTAYGFLDVPYTCKNAAYAPLNTGIKLGWVAVDKSSRPYVYYLTKSGKAYRAKHGSFLKAKLEQRKRDVIYLEKLIRHIKKHGTLSKSVLG